MIKKIAQFLIWGLLFFSLIFAYAEGSGQAKIPTLNSPIMDQVGVFSSSAKVNLERKLIHFWQEKGSQIVVLIVPTTSGEDVFDYSTRVFDQWKLGGAEHSDGVLIVVVTEDKRVRISSGGGIEAIVTDVQSGRIIREDMTPHFKEGHYELGITLAVNKLIDLIEKGDLPPPVEENQDSIIELLMILLFIQLFFYFLRSLFGNFFTSFITALLSGLAAYLLGYSMIMVVFLAFCSFWVTFFGMLYILFEILKALDAGQNSTGRKGGGFGGGGFSGGGGGGFSGGGGGFRGGGASGSW